MTSGNKDCSKYSCNESGMCHGTLIDGISASDANSCLGLCQNNPACLWFTYLPQDQLCIQLADCSDLLPCIDCLSGQRQCQADGSMNKILVRNGNFELMDLSNISKPNCPLPDYPAHINYTDPRFVTFDEKARLVRLVGGNSSSSENSKNNCFTFDGLKWEEDMESPSDSYFNWNDNLSSSMFVADIGWWISECDWPHDCDVNSISSEVYSSTNGSWMSGPSYVEINGTTFPGYGFCGAQLNKTHSMLTGGQPFGSWEESVTDVMIYDWTKEEWSKGAPMQSSRARHQCTPFGSGSFMVTGGYEPYEGTYYTTEIYDPEIDSWYYSKDLPTKVDGNLINWNGYPLFVAPHNVWKFENGDWTLLNSTPNSKAYSNFGKSNFATLLPDDFIPDC